MQQLHNFWKALEHLPAATAAGAEWRFRLGDDFESLKRLLLPTDRLAESIPVSNDPYESYQVVQHTAGDFVGVHTGDDTVVPLTKSDLLIYRADIPRLANHLAEAFHFQPNEQRTSERTSLLQIGTFRPNAGLQFPVYLALPLEPDDLLSAIEVVTSRHREPFLILAPSARCLHQASEQLLERSKACFLSLMESVELGGKGEWVATELARQRISAFQSLHVDEYTARRPEGNDSRAMKNFQHTMTVTTEFLPTPSSDDPKELRDAADYCRAQAAKMGDGRAMWWWTQAKVYDASAAEAASKMNSTNPIVQPAAPIDEPLNLRSQQVLIAMHELKAFDSDNRQSNRNICEKAFGRMADENATKEVTTDLKVRGFLLSKRGSGGGYWLAPKGRERAVKLGSG